MSDDIDILRTQLYTEHLRLRQTIAATTSSVETLQRELKSVCLNKRCGLSVCFSPYFLRCPTKCVCQLDARKYSMLGLAIIELFGGCVPPHFDNHGATNLKCFGAQDGDRWKAKSVPAPSRPIYGLL